MEISPTLRINETIQALRREGRPVRHLGFGESQFPPPPVFVEALRRHAAEVRYFPVQGLAELREEIAALQSRLTGQAIGPDRVIVTPGSKAALFLAFSQMEGDVLLPRPSWVSYAPQARLANKQVYWIDTALEHGYFPTPAALRAACAHAARAGGRPRLLVINNPNNPTGVHAQPAALAELAHAAEALGLTIISDEIYGQLLPPGEFQSPQALAPRATVVTSGLSKDAGLGGWRLGWAILPDTAEGRSAMACFRAFASEMWSSPASPVQCAALEGLRAWEGCRADVEALAALHGARTAALFHALRELSLKLPEPAGGYYVYPDFEAHRLPLAQRGIHTSEELADHLLREYGIASLPGTAFGERPQSLRLRLSSTHLDAGTPEQAHALWSEWVKGENCARTSFVRPDTHPELFATIADLRSFRYEFLAKDPRRSEASHA